MFTPIEKRFLQDLKVMGTWRLFFLGVVTYGVYWAYYMKRQTDVLNAHAEEERGRISTGFVNAFMVISYLSLAALVVYFIILFAMGEDSPYLLYIDKSDTIITAVWQVMLLIWSFKAKARMNVKLGLSEGDPNRLKGIYTFLCSIFYINFKINEMNKEI